MRDSNSSSRGRFKRRGVAGVAAIAVALGALAVVAVVTGLSESDDGSPASPKVISGFGIRMQLPKSWDGRVYRRSPRDAVTLEAASVPLAPRADDSFQETEKRMGAGDAYIWLSDIGSPPPYIGREPGWQMASLPIKIDASDLHRYVEGHSLPANAVRPFVINDRAITLYVGFGSWPNEAVIQEINSVLASLSISARETP